MTMRWIFRVFVAGVKRLEETVEGPADDVWKLLPQLARRHVAMLLEEPGWIEVEFPDEPDPNQRFFRIGTDKSGMVMPILFMELTDDGARGDIDHNRHSGNGDQL